MPLYFCLRMLGLGIHADRKAAWPRRLSLSMLSIILTVLVVEFAGQLLGYDFAKQQEALDAWPIFYRQPTVPVGDIYFRRSGPATWTGRPLSTGLALAGGGETTYADEEEVTITYDPQGFRNPPDLTDWKIVVIGDSFVELGHLPYRDLFTTRLAERLGVRVKNLGASYSGPLTYLYFLKEYGVSPSARHAIFVFFEGNDIADLGREEELRQAFRITGERPYREIQRQTSLIMELLRLWNPGSAPGSAPSPVLYQNASLRWKAKEIPVTVTYAPPRWDELTGKQQKLLTAVIADWSRTSWTLGMMPWLVYMPTKRHVLDGHLHFSATAEPRLRQWRRTDLARAVRELTLASGAGFIDLTPALVSATERGILTYNPVWDTHLNPEGCRLVAQTIGEALRSHH